MTSLCDSYLSRAASSVFFSSLPRDSPQLSIGQHCFHTVHVTVVREGELCAGMGTEQRNSDRPMYMENPCPRAVVHGLLGNQDGL